MTTIRRTTDIFKEGEFGEFVVRKHTPPLWQLVALFFTCFMVLFLVAANAHILGGNVGLGLAIFAVIGPLTWYTVFYAQHNRDMVLAAEFQNALFSAAARLKSQFCMIVKQDGTIFYYDRGFQALFPETANRGVLMLDKILSTKHISLLEAQKLDHALEHNHSETVIIQLQQAEGDPLKVIITIDPINRPAGFFILRGREFVVKQYDRLSASENSLSQKIPLLEDPNTSITLTHMLQTMPTGLYATDPDGNILFMNYRMESWLGYGQNEVAATNIQLQDLIPHQNTPTAEGLFLRNCDGPVRFNTRDGRGITLHVHQEITRAESGASLGTVAVLQRIEQAKPADAELAQRESSKRNF